MRGLSKPLGLGVVLLTLFSVSVTYAGEPSPLDPPQVKISPPIGVAAATPGSSAKISPPGGIAAPELGFFTLLWTWIEAQAKIGPPAG